LAHNIFEQWYNNLLQTAITKPKNAHLLTRLPIPDAYPLETDFSEISVSDELMDDFASEMLSD
jgi:hypothetical protein